MTEAIPANPLAGLPLGEFLPPKQDKDSTWRLGARFPADEVERQNRMDGDVPRHRLGARPKPKAGDRIIPSTKGGQPRE